MQGHPIERRTFIAAGATLAAAGALQIAFPSLAHADEIFDLIEEQEELSQRIVEMQAKLEEDTDAYYKAIEEHDNALLAVTEVDKRIADNDEQIAQLQAKLKERMTTRYKSDDFGMYDALLSSMTLDEFTRKWDMIDRMNETDVSLISQVKELRAQNEVERTDKQAREDLARTKMEEAQQIQERAQETIKELEALYSQVTDEVKALIERDQAASLASIDTDVKIIGNPRGIEPSPEVVEEAEKCMGKPYVWAAAGPDSFDCSGLVVWCYEKAGLGYLPHYTESLYKLALATGAVVTLAEVQPGDVLYRPGHVGIATHEGGVPYIHAPMSGALVRNTDSLSFSSFVCGLRFPR